MSMKNNLPLITTISDFDLYNFLQLKEKRFLIQKNFLKMDGTALITVSLNIPGSLKNKPLYSIFFDQIVKINFFNFLSINQISENIIKIKEIKDQLGNYLIIVLNINRLENLINLKKKLLLFEQKESSFFLVDVDLINHQHKKISRDILNFSPRRCYLCHNFAKICVKKQTHLLKDLINFIDNKISFLLNNF